MAQSVGNLAIQLTATGAALAQGLSKAKGMLTGFAGEVASVGSALTGMAAVGSAAAFAALVKSESEAIDNTSKLAERLDVGTEALVGLQHAANLADVSSEELAGGLTRFSRQLGDLQAGSKEAAAAFAKVGLSARDLAGKSVEQALGMFADKLNALPTASARTSAALALLGRGAGPLITFLKEGSAGFKEMQAEAEAFGLTFTKVQGKMVEESNDALTRVGAVIKGFARQLAIELAPALQAAAKGFTDWAKAGNESGEGMTRTMKTFYRTGGVALDFGENLKEFFTGDIFGVLGGGSTKHREDVEAFLRGKDKLIKGQKELANAPAWKVPPLAKEDWGQIVEPMVAGLDLFKDLHTPLEKFRAEMDALNLFIMEGAIDWQVYERAAGKAVETLQKAGKTGVPEAPRGVLAGSQEAFSMMARFERESQHGKGESLKDTIERQTKVEERQALTLEKILAQLAGYEVWEGD